MELQGKIIMNICSQKFFKHLSSASGVILNQEIKIHASPSIPANRVPIQLDI